MAYLIGLILGAALGAYLAHRRGGNRMDMLHFGAVFGIIGLLVALFVGLVLFTP